MEEVRFAKSFWGAGSIELVNESGLGGQEREKSGMTPFRIVWSLHGVERMDDMHILEEAGKVWLLPKME